MLTHKSHSKEIDMSTKQMEKEKATRNKAHILGSCPGIIILVADSGTEKDNRIS